MGNAVFVAFFHICYVIGYGGIGGGSSGCLGCTLIIRYAVDVPAMASFGGRLLIIADFVFVLLVFLLFGFY